MPRQLAFVIAFAFMVSTAAADQQRDADSPAGSPEAAARLFLDALDRGEWPTCVAAIAPAVIFRYEQAVNEIRSKAISSEVSQTFNRLDPDYAKALIRTVTGIETMSGAVVPGSSFKTEVMGRVTTSTDAAYVVYRRQISVEMVPNAAFSKLGALALRHVVDGWRIVNAGGDADFTFMTGAAAAASRVSGENGSADEIGAKQEVRNAMLQWREAKIHHDVATLDRLMTDDFLEVNQNSDRLHRQQILELYKSPDLDFTGISIEDAEIEVSGTTARATGTHVERVKYRGREVGGRLGFVEVYVKSARGWQIQSSRLHHFVESETVNVPKASGGSIELVAISPAAHSSVSADSLVTAELHYDIEQFEPGLFQLTALFETNKPDIRTMPKGWTEPPLVTRKGRIKVAIPARLIWNDRDVRRPFELSFCVNQLIGTLGGSASVACTKKVTFEPASSMR